MKSKTNNSNNAILKIVIILLIVIMLAFLIFFLFFKKETVSFADRKLNLVTNYRQAVIKEMSNYLEENNTNLATLPDGESLTIDAKNIVADSKYNACSGNLKITKVGDTFEYLPDVNCENNDEETNITYKIYNGVLDNSFITEDGIFISSQKNIKYETIEDTPKIVSADLMITLYDKDGNLKWSVVYDKLNTQENPTFCRVMAINKIENMYYVIITEHTKDSQIAYLIRIDLEGKIINDNKLQNNGLDINQAFYIGSKDKTGYYTDDINSIFSISDNDYKIISLDNSWYDTKKELFLLDDSRVNDNNIYIIGNLNSYSKNYDDYNMTGFKLVKLQLDGKLVKEKNILKKDVIFNSMQVTDKYIYITYYDENKGKDKIAKYTKDLKLIKENLDYRQGLDAKIKFYDLVYKNKKLYFEFKDDYNYYLKVTDENEKTLETYKTVDKDYIYEKYYNLVESSHINDKFIQVYSKNDINYLGENELALLIYNK